MNKKGFTLAEVLGVVIILSLLSLIAVPQLLSTIRSHKESLNEANEEIIFSATNLYLSNNESSFPKKNGNVYCIEIKTLVDNNYLEESLYDVNTNKEYDLTKIVKVEVNESKYDKKIVEINECETINN